MSNYSSSSFKPDPNSSWFKIFSLIEDKTSVLDIGCSSGNFGEVLTKEKKCVVDGIEIDEGDFKAASKKLRKVYQLNIETDDLKEIGEKYDYLYFGDVVEHLVWPVQTLERVKSLLKPNGKVLFSIPNMAFIAIRLELLKGEFEYTETGLLDKTHLHYYTLKEVQRVFNDAGYGLDSIDFVESGYSTDYVKSQLAEVGLTGSKKFFDFIKTPEASAFQFVGAASPGKRNKPTKLKLFSPINGQDGYYKKIMDEYEEKLGRLDADVRLLNKQLHEVYNSRKYKIVSSLSGGIHKVKKVVTSIKR